MINQEMISKAVEETYRRALISLPEDVRGALAEASDRETDPIAKETFSVLLKNLDLAKEKSMTICQDTGLPEFFIKIGSMVRMEGDLEEAVRQGVVSLTKKFPLLPFVVHPLTRENTGTNTGVGVPIMDYQPLAGADYIELAAVVGPAQPQSFSRVAMFPPSAPIGEIKKFVYETMGNITGAVCPPLIVGIGIGGLFDSVTKIAKKASLRPLNRRNPDPTVAQLEAELLEQINRMGIGHMALGGRSTALAVNIEVGHTHLPCLPVAIQLQCWCSRRATARIYADGRIEEVL